MRPWGRILMMPGPHISIIFVYFRGVQRLAIVCLKAGAEPLEGTDIPLEFLHRHRAAGAEAGKKRLELAGQRVNGPRGTLRASPAAIIHACEDAADAPTQPRDQLAIFGLAVARFQDRLPHPPQIGQLCSQRRQIDAIGADDPLAIRTAGAEALVVGAVAEGDQPHRHQPVLVAVDLRRRDAEQFGRLLHRHPDDRHAVMPVAWPRHPHQQAQMRDQLRRHAPVLRQMRSDLLEDLHRLEAVEVGFWLEAPRAPVGGGVAVGEFPATQWPGPWRGLGS